MAVAGRVRALALAASLLVSGCGATASPTSTTSGPSASAVVSGGSDITVSLPDGAALQVPAGAVTAGAHASVSRQLAPTDGASAAWPDRAVGPAYHFDLGGATPAAPVTLTVPFDASSLPANTTPADLVLAYHDEATGSWVPVPSSVDAAAGKVTAQVSHLSDWALWAPDWDYWLALLKKSASGNLADLWQAIKTFAAGCQTTAGEYTVDNSIANRMIQGCLTKTSASGATLEIRNLRAFALEVSDPRGYVAGAPVLLAPGDSVSLDVAASDASPVVVEANMSGLGLTASVVDIVLGLLPNIGAARASVAWGPAFKEIVGTVDKLHALTDAITEAEAGHYPQAAEAAAKAISGVDFLTTLGAAAHAAGVKYEITALSQVSQTAISRVMAVVGLSDLIVTSWSFFGDYFFNAHTEVHLVWTSPLTPTPTPTPTPTATPAPLARPGAPSGVTETVLCSPSFGGDCPSGPTLRVTWKGASGSVAGYRIYWQSVDPCANPESYLSTLQSFGQANATARSVTGTISDGVFAARLVVVAYNAAGTGPAAYSSSQGLMEGVCG
jgi:hypothetical protein